uniref:Uncharacterized protein n=1 Tax=Siphoviridae sp. ctBLh2 TaxID=2827803 RepID=A0A8S5S3V9_9CAUD|nr:MAG TPA: hypothetical protein [Siphoviridae sp. ctBLh2]
MAPSERAVTISSGSAWPTPFFCRFIAAIPTISPSAVSPATLLQFTY